MHSGYLATTLSPPLGRMGARIAAMAHHSNDGNYADLSVRSFCVSSAAGLRVRTIPTSTTTAVATATNATTGQ
ncbi:hypothetical protein M0802_004574 [Mischocyttarus mexicanus]|nr:hypothetical protein M0802_004574 [Mischocyttarus mexicanus]